MKSQVKREVRGSKIRPKPKKGSLRVESWVYSVINPLIESFNIEESFLKKKNWTWRYWSRSLEFIYPIKEYLDAHFWPNYEDFLRANPVGGLIGLCIRDEIKILRREDILDIWQQNGTLQ